MYSKPAFLKTIIAATTAGNIFYPPASVDGTPVLPIVLHPKMQDGSASPGPEQLCLRSFAPGVSDPRSMSDNVCGYLCSANGDGSVSRRWPIYVGQAYNLDSPDAVVIEKIETEIPVAFELLGYSDQPSTQN
jgi:hypothetical protein